MKKTNKFLKSISDLENALTFVDKGSVENDVEMTAFCKKFEGQPCEPSNLFQKAVWEVCSFMILPKLLKFRHSYPVR